MLSHVQGGANSQAKLAWTCMQVRRVNTNARSKLVPLYNQPFALLFFIFLFFQAQQKPNIIL